MRQLPVPFCFAALAAAFSCAGDDGPPDAPDEFCELFAEAACNTEVIQACQATDAEACRTSQVAFCLAQLPAASFSGQTAEECLDAVEAAYADADLDAVELGTVLRFEAPCNRLSSGPGEAGTACNDARDCNTLAGFECVRHGSIAATCQRAELTGPGEDCSAVGAVCTAGFYCDGSHCIVGQALGEPCITSEQCGRDGYCGALSVCESRLPLQAACGFDEQCNSGVCYRLPQGQQMCVDRLRLSVSEPICDDLR